MKLSRSIAISVLLTFLPSHAAQAANGWKRIPGTFLVSNGIRATYKYRMSKTWWVDESKTQHLLVNYKIKTINSKNSTYEVWHLNCKKRTAAYRRTYRFTTTGKYVIVHSESREMPRYIYPGTANYWVYEFFCGVGE
jgi:hypothetical protein